jgi:8-oxo-dGTP diphosphatase
MFHERIKFLQKCVVYHPADNRFLVLQRSDNDEARPGCWDLPGGNVKYGEQHDHALLREINEETGLSISNFLVRYVKTRYLPGEDRYWLFLGHTAQATSVEVTLSGEHQAFRWVKPSEFIALDSASYLRTFIEQISQQESC